MYGRGSGGSARWLRQERSPPGVTRRPQRLFGEPGSAETDAGGLDPWDRTWRRRSPTRADSDCALGGGEALRLLLA
ncbi:hypothetical protein NDU88_003039 [Pleurodeles waltl]|uniref:Uncharacterized protein n=1 Tax=Pleurodeles waltl TaxID=8319 RepID=A0AAV7RGA5_PLEWA|nr:hypothetical protein NDU88_003039 [Pleurodeles waltl]